MKFLFFSKEFQTFLKGTKDNTELEKILKGLGEQSVEELIEKYAKIFNGLNGVENIKKNKGGISEKIDVKLFFGYIHFII